MAFFQPPQLRVGAEAIEESRRATWLELFFDLVFVVAVSQVAHHLSAHVSWLGFLEFSFLFLPIWLAWTGATTYVNRFDADSISNRLLTALQMLALAAMAVNVHAAFGKTAAAFALSYVAVRLVLVGQYVLAAIHLPPARSLAKRYIFSMGLAALVWLSSAWVAAPLCFWLWGLGLAIDLLGPPLLAAQQQAKLLLNFEHLPERFGLFTIIVLGEAIIAVVGGVAEQEWTWRCILAGSFGFAIAFCLWWLYFDNVGSTALRAAGEAGQVRVLQAWFYGHLPLVLGIASAGVGVEKVILGDLQAPLPSSERWLLCGSVALCMLSLSFLHRMGIVYRCKVRTKYRLGAAIALLLLAGFGQVLTPPIVAGAVAIVCALQVAQDLYQGHASPTQQLPELG